MTTKRTFTSKKNLPCVIIYSTSGLVEAVVIQRTNGTFGIHDETNTNGQEGLFDEQPFISAYNDYKAKKETERLRKEQEARQAEEMRNAELKARISKCETPQELAEEFNLTMIGGKAVEINSLDELEVIELAKDIHNIDGEWAGYEYNGHFRKDSFYWVYDLAHFQENIRKAYSNGSNYFYRSPESEAESYNGTVIPDILNDEQLSEVEKLEAIKKATEEWEAIEPGYYDCNGSLVIEEKVLEAKDFTGCSEDSKTWQFCFQFEYANSFNNNEAEE